MSEWRVDNSGTGDTVSIYAGDALLSDIYDEQTALRIVREHNAALAQQQAGDGALMILDGMAACLEALERNNLWFSRSMPALTLRDSLRTWLDEYRALAAVPRQDDADAPERCPECHTTSRATSPDYGGTCVVCWRRRNGEFPPRIPLKIDWTPPS